MHHHLKGSYWQSEDSAHTDTLHYLVTFSSEDTVYVRGSLAASSASARSKHRQVGKSFKWGMIAYLLKKNNHIIGISILYCQKVFTHLPSPTYELKLHSNLNPKDLI